MDAERESWQGVQQSTNDQIHSLLLASRRAVVKFLDKSRPLEIMTLKAVKRACIATPDGFIIRVLGHVHSKDPTIGRWLLQKPWPAFELKHQGVYGRWLDDNTRIVFYNEGANMNLRWHIGYEIRCNQRPSLPNPEPPNAEIEAFVLKVMWPQVMALRTQKWYPKQL